MKNVGSSAAECKTEGVFHNAQTAIPIKYILKEIGHPQSATTLSMDNNTTEKFIKKQYYPKEIKISGYEILLVARTTHQKHGKNQLII